MWLMLQQSSPDDYVVATGLTHSVREFVEMTFRLVGLDYQKYVVVDERLYRPSEVNLLVGDASKAGRTLGWKYTMGFVDLVREMLLNDCRALGLADVALFDARERARTDILYASD
jgi:GDPmannose 4,6-dehydratase